MKQKRIIPYLYMVPGILLLVLFVYYPIGCNCYYSLLKWDLFKGTKTFIGFKNFVNLLADETFHVAFVNNIRYVVISIVFQVGVALLFAAQIEQYSRRIVGTVFRTILFIPSLISLTIIGLLFSFVYKTDGLLNSFLSLFGTPVAKGWLGDAKTAIYAVIAVSQWKSVGYTMMLLIVAIQRIPKDLYEAGIIDGASKITMFRKITVPLIQDMIKIALIINVTGGLLVFNEVFVMTNGGPHGTSEVLSTIMYKNAFTYGKVGYASSIAIVILLLSLVFFILQQAVSQKSEEA